MLAFDPTTHTYTVDGQRVPSVTDCIRAAGLMPDMRYATAWHMDRGTQVHLACQLYDEGDLDPDSIDPLIAGYVAAYLAFRADMGDRLSYTAIEHPYYHAGLRVAGTPDRVGLLDASSVVIDLKTSATHAPWMGVQLAGYSLLAGTPAAKRLGLHLHEDGTYRLVPYADRADAAVFQSCATLWHWRSTHGLLAEELNP